MIRGLIFDFDGTILDTEVPDYEAWRELYAEYGVTLPLDAWLPMIGTHGGVFDVYGYLEERAGRPLDRADVQARRRARLAEMIAAAVVLPGVAEWIADAKARGMKVGLASSSSRAWVVGHLERLGLHVHFDAILSGDMVPRVKPDPALYHAALAALGLDAAEAVALEDSAHGIAAAKAAGIFTIAIPNGMTRHSDLSAADLQLASLTDLTLDAVLTTIDASTRSAVSGRPSAANREGRREKADR